MSTEGNQNHELLDACRRGDIEFLRKYVEHKEKKDFAIFDENELGPLYWAVHSGSYECVELLISTKLIDVGVKTSYDRNALDCAIFKNSCDMIRLLLKNDPNFDLITPTFGFLTQHEEMSTEVMQTIIDTLEDMRFPFANAFEFLHNIVRNFDFSGDNEAKQIKIFERLVALVINETADDFMSRIFDALACAGSDERIILMRWCIAKWHSEERNKHHNLVQKLLKNPELGFNESVIFFLHSNIRDEVDESETLFFLKKIVECLLKVDLNNRDVINEVLDVLWSKINTSVLWELYYNCETRDHLLTNSSVEWLDVIRLGDKIGLELIGCDEGMDLTTILYKHMPFSIEVTADEFVSDITKRLKMVKFTLEYQFQSPFRTADLEAEYKYTTESLKRLENDDELAKYCVEGVYRMKCSLKSLCRAVIRKCLLRLPRVENSHSKLLEDIRSIKLPNNKALPNSLRQFLLFNYSSYNF